MNKLLIFFVSFFLFTSVHAQSFNIQPTGIQGSAGFGFVHYNVKDPNPQTIDFDQGVYASIGGEKGFGFMNLYLTISLNYLKTDGQSMYSYTNADGTYASNKLVDFSTNLFQAGLGFKLKLIDDSWFRPYIEAGGLFGYFQIQYKNLALGTNMTGPNSNFKTRDSIFDLGYYGEAGIEIAFSPTFGIRAAFRDTRNKTKQFETLADQKITYEAQVYYLSLLKSF